MSIILKLKIKPDLYLEADAITPDNFAGKTLDEIKNMPVFMGNQQLKISDFFDVSGKKCPSIEETSIKIEGDCALVQRIGEKMSAGSISIDGNCGMHLGNTMTGGKITVTGNAGEWAAAMMDGGEIIINGNAGDHCAGAYRGFWVGMNNGKVTVKGHVGVESGSWMRATRSRKKYPIFECGSADYYLGIHNHGGTIICSGDAEGRVGADMARGQIIVNGQIKHMLPSFKSLGEKVELKTPAGTIKGNYQEYAGDFAVDPKPNGRIYANIKNN